MADSTILNLTAASTLTNADTIPVVQGGANKKATLALAPVSTPQQTALNLKANLAAPALTGIPTAPTASNGTNTTQLATTAFVLANASLASDPLKANLASPTFTGVPAAPTAAPGTATTQIANAAFIDAAKRLVPSTVKTASYTLALADAGTLVRMNVATANDLIVPPNSTVAFPIDTVILPSQYGASTTTITAGAGVTLRARGGLLVLNGQYAVASLQKIGTNEWLVAGDLLESAPPPAATYGPELWPQPLFDASTNLTLDANWSIAAGVATSNGGAGFITATTPPLTIGITYRAEVVVSSYTGGTVWTPYDGTGSGQATFAAAAGTFTKQFVAASTGLMIYSDLFTGSITSASLKAVL